jgi:hypothetical protein
MPRGREQVALLELFQSRAQIESPASRASSHGKVGVTVRVHSELTGLHYVPGVSRPQWRLPPVAR